MANVASVILTSHALRNYSEVLHERDSTSLSLLFIASSNRHHTESTPQRCLWRPVIRVYDEAGNVIETHDHTRASSKSRKVFCSRHVAFPAKMNFHDSAFIGWLREKPGGLDAWQPLCDS